MLQCTPAAARTLDEARAQQAVPDTCGTRFFPVRNDDGAIVLGIALAEPVDGDQVIEQHGTQLIVAPEIVDELADLTLDITDDPGSNGRGSAQLVLRPQQG